MMTKSVKRFLESEEGKDIKKKLQAMTFDVAYNTEPSFSTNVGQYPDNLIPFTDKHMKYLSTHPSINTQQYLANIKLKSRIR